MSKELDKIRAFCGPMRASGAASGGPTCISSYKDFRFERHVSAYLPPTAKTLALDMQGMELLQDINRRELERRDVGRRDIELQKLKLKELEQEEQELQKNIEVATRNAGGSIRVAGGSPELWTGSIDSLVLDSPVESQAVRQTLSKPRQRSEATRNLVLCLDGTSNQFSTTNTNVIKLFGVLHISSGPDKKGQLAYYDSGVGTYLPVGASGTWSRKRQDLGKALDLATAWNFKDHVKNAYKWLMDYYQPKDKIFLFGFSRGAYAVRVLAGMIERVGLLPAGNHSQIPLAYDVYRSRGDVGSRGHFAADVDLASRYRSMFGITRRVNVHFIGVWDTVSSLGGLSAPELPFADTVSMVTYFRQALALDERRVKFQPEFRRSSSSEQEAINGIPRNKEVWFLGVHTAVGGGSDPDDGPSLSNVPFRWMLWEAVQCGLRTAPTGIIQCYALMSIPTVAEEVKKFVPESIMRKVKTVFPRVSADGRVSLKRTLTNELQEAFTEHHRRRVIRLAAGYDTLLSSIREEAEAGLPMTRDLSCPKRESLRHAYVPMEYLVGVVHRRWYAIDPETGEYTERRDKKPNRGKGRYIQMEQKIHRSVLKRAWYDHAMAAAAVPADRDHKPYPPIHAHLPPVDGMSRTWPEVLHLDVREDLWEVVEPLLPEAALSPDEG